MFKFIRIVFRIVITIACRVIVRVFRKIWPRNTNSGPAVQVSQGTVRGATSTLPNGAPYHYFQGIPYAKPPTGELRFKPPVALEKFDTPVINCTQEGDHCMQLFMFIDTIVVGSEGPLVLNVYSPVLPSEQNANPQLPVMVFIHGGGFESGSGDAYLYDPVYLLQEGVLVVTMNYRLGPLGFLSLPSMGIPGNAGLKDQMLALKWIRQNVAQFGGDPSNVTLFGQSAGSWSVYLHYLSPNSRKYFNRAICKSGVACTESFFQIDPVGKARKLAEILGYRGSSDLGVYETLMKAPARLLVKHQRAVANEEEHKMAMNFPFRPVIEQIETDDSIITAAPEKILKQFDSIRMPLITGCCSGEGVLALWLMNRKKQSSCFDKEPDRLVPCFLKEAAGLDCQTQGAEIKRFFFGASRFTKQTRQQMCDLMSDLTFVAPIMINAEWLARYQPNVLHWNYRFSFVGRFNMCKVLYQQQDLKGPSHSDDIYHLFNSAYLPSLPPDSIEMKVRGTFVRLLTNFAKFGHPTPAEKQPSSSSLTSWNPVQNVDPTLGRFDLDCLEIGIDCVMTRNPCEHRINFWRGLLQRCRPGYLFE